MQTRGIVIEYAGAKGRPQWVKRKALGWDYTQFGRFDAAPANPDETMDSLIVKHNGAIDGFNQWTLNGKAFSMETMTPTHKIHEGRRYRLKFLNASDDVHPLHLHRHSFELARIGGKSTAGVIKDAVMLGGFQEIEFDFVAENPGMTLHLVPRISDVFRYSPVRTVSTDKASFRRSEPDPALVAS